MKFSVKRILSLAVALLLALPAVAISEGADAPQSAYEDIADIALEAPVIEAVEVPANADVPEETEAPANTDAAEEAENPADADAAEETETPAESDAPAETPAPVDAEPLPMEWDDLPEIVVYAEPVDAVIADDGTLEYDLPTEDDALDIPELVPETQFYADPQYDDDGDALLDAYVQGMIDDSLGKRSGRSIYAARTHLTGNDKAVYELLQPMVAALASGKAKSNIAIFELSDTDLSAKGVDCGPWTAADLNVTSLTVTGANGGTTYNPDATSAAWSRMSFSLTRVINALRFDYPEQMYWYGNKARYKNLNLNIRRREGSNEYELYCSTNTSMKIGLSVSNSYADNSAEYTRPFENDTLVYAVDTGKVELAQTALANAAQVVSSTSGTPLERLTAYREYICNAVSYNTPAATGELGITYGDPWQMIYVFDGDLGTNVVCEGYAKAFKYLVDLSIHNGLMGSKYECLVVTGLLNNKEKHMWNIMRMDDGRNYLVDVTNCDAHAVGYPDKLFMAYGPSGSVDEGYTFTVGEKRTLSYKYDYWISETDYSTDTRTSYTVKDLTISETEYSPVPWHITVSGGIAHGTVRASTDVTWAGNAVQLTVTPDAGYLTDRLSVTYVEDGKTVSVAVSNNRFTMPTADVTVTATFKAKPVATPTPRPTATPAPVATPAPAAPAAVSAPTPAPTPPTIYAPSNTRTTVSVGTAYQIDTAGAAAKKFKSSNRKVASVTAAGVVIPKKAGKVKISFKVGKKKRTVTLKVVDPTIPTAIALNLAGTVAAKVGMPQALTVSTLPEGTYSGIKWTSSNKKVATVKNGVVTFKKAGKVTITATAKRGKKKAKVKFVVSK